MATSNYNFSSIAHHQHILGFKRWSFVLNQYNDRDKSHFIQFAIYYGAVEFALVARAGNRLIGYFRFKIPHQEQHFRKFECVRDAKWYCSPEMDDSSVLQHYINASSQILYTSPFKTQWLRSTPYDRPMKSCSRGHRKYTLKRPYSFSSYPKHHHEIESCVSLANKLVEDAGYGKFLTPEEDRIFLRFGSHINRLINAKTVQPLSFKNYPTNDARTNNGTCTGQESKGPVASTPGNGRVDDTVIDIFTDDKMEGEKKLYFFASDERCRPVKEKVDDVGYDLKANADVDIPPKEVAVIPTGFSYWVPNGWYLQIVNRCSTSCKGLSVLDGVLDDNFRDEVTTLIWNTSNENYSVKKGDKIAQMLLRNSHEDMTVRYLSGPEELDDEIKDLYYNGSQSGSSGSESFWVIDETAAL